MIRANKYSCKIEGPFSDIMCDFANLASAIQRTLFDERKLDNITQKEFDIIRCEMLTIMHIVFNTNNESGLMMHAAEARKHMDRIVETYYGEPLQREDDQDSFTRTIDLRTFNDKNEGGNLQ